MAHIGTLFIISAASGVGKTSLVQAMIHKLDNLSLSISYTTRDKRLMEQDGINYFFVTTETFLQMQNNDEFLESAKVFGNYYGTSKKLIIDLLEQGKDIILEIDWQGAQQIRQQVNSIPKLSDKIFNRIKIVNIFVLPPSLQVLANRLVARGQDNATVMQHRLNAAKAEMQHYKEYEYLIINDNFNQAVEELSAIIRANRLTLGCQQVAHTNLINSLLEQNNNGIIL